LLLLLLFSHRPSWRSRSWAAGSWGHRRSRRRNGGAPPPRGGDGDAGGEGHAARCSADEFNLERAPVELDAVVRLDGLDGVAFVGEDNLRGALGPAVLVEVEAGLLHLADLREQLLRVANSEWRLGEGIRCQGPFVESIRVGEAA